MLTIITIAAATLKDARRIVAVRFWTEFSSINSPINFLVVLSEKCPVEFPNPFVLLYKWMDGSAIGMVGKG